MRYPHPARPTDCGAALLGTRTLFQSWAQHDGYVYWGDYYPSQDEAEAAAAELLRTVKDPGRETTQGQVA
jgi:hypothetical protein